MTIQLSMLRTICDDWNHLKAMEKNEGTQRVYSFIASAAYCQREIVMLWLHFGELSYNPSLCTIYNDKLCYTKFFHTPFKTVFIILIAIFHLSASTWVINHGTKVCFIKTRINNWQVGKGSRAKMIGATIRVRAILYILTFCFHTISALTVLLIRWAAVCRPGPAAGPNDLSTQSVSII